VRRVVRRYRAKRCVATCRTASGRDAGFSLAKFALSVTWRHNKLRQPPGRILQQPRQIHPYAAVGSSESATAATAAATSGRHIAGEEGLRGGGGDGTERGGFAKGTAARCCRQVLPPGAAARGGREWDPQRAWMVTAWFAAERSGLPRVVRESGGASRRMARRILPNRGFRDVDCGASRRRTSAWAKVAVTIISAPIISAPIISAPIMRRALLGAPASARRLATPCWWSLRVERVCAARPGPSLSGPYLMISVKA
jgi:hypothetical protein